MRTPAPEVDAHHPPANDGPVVAAASRRLWRWSGAGLAVLLVSCGGGGDSGALPATDVAGSSGAAGATPPGAASAPDGGASSPTATLTATCGLGDFATSALAHVNRMRAAGATCGARGSFAPTAALRWSDRLTQSGTAHAQDMATANYFSHTSLDGRTLADRVNATGYLWLTLGENIAAGFTTMGDVVDAWAASDGHCANLMNPTFTEVGLACVAGTTTSHYRTYWTMNLGRPQ